jgi:DNA-binding NtrC family response regulator
MQRAGEADRLIQQKVRVQVIGGPDRGKQIELAEERLLIGTHPRCDLQLSDPSVSRQHAELRVSSAGLVLQDLSSTNGTWAGGLRVGEAVLPAAIEIDVGDSRLSIAAIDEEVVHELSLEGRFGEMIGTSPAMRSLFAKLQRVAAVDATVLLEGESGTGKEMAALAIHQRSPRAEGPFVVVDCGALPRELIESELFGHERGAFTGATHSRQGAFEQADGGTLFLDEIGELDLDLQPKLLRALESRQVKRLGGNQTRSVDIRVVSATNRNLRRQVTQGAFREDLYFRISVVQLTLPPLRVRREDIPLLVEHFIEQLTRGKERFAISPEVVRRLAQRPWPGNARELRNVVERALALGSLDEQPSFVATPGKPAAPDEADLSALRPLPYKVARARLLDGFERDYLGALLQRHQGNLTQSARAAEIDRVYLLRLLDKHDMRRTGKGTTGTGSAS